MAGKPKKVKLLRSIILNGEHAEKGEVHELPANQAAHLVGDRSAEYVGDSFDEAMEENKGGVKVHEPLVQTREPQVTKVSDAPKAKKA